MKRVMFLFIIMLLPMSVWAMTPVSDSALSDVIGQAGVNINADLTMSINIGTMAWGDESGINDATANFVWFNEDPVGGYIGVTGFNIDQLTIVARYDSNDTYNGYSTLFLKPITIDVATGDKTAVGGAADTTYVRFGLGALKVGISQLQFSVALGARPAADGDPVVLDQQMGLVSIDQMEIYFNPWSYVDIFAHAGCGVTMDMNVIIDQLTLPRMSWGDTDGIGDTSTLSNNEDFWMSGVTEGGYIGFNNFSISADPDDVNLGAISMKGAVAIDVVTSNGGPTASSGLYSYLHSLYEALKPAYPYINFSSEAEMIAFYDWLVNDFNLGDPSILNNGQDVALAARTYVRYVQSGPQLALSYTALPLTVVHISFPSDFNIHVGMIRGDVAIGNDAYFAGSYTGTLGDIFIQKADLTVWQNSWVDIWAH